jgi:2-hydroxyglutarate dehydrogenase
MDFTFLYHSSLKSLASQALWQKDIPKEAQGGGLMISLLGIESPGLTSSLAIGEMLQEKIAKEVWGDHNSSRVKHVQNEELGGKELDGWA